jgi:hypothetical protein
MGRQHQERLFVAAEYKWMTKTNNWQGYLETYYWKGGQGPMRAVAPLKKKNNKNVCHKMIHFVVTDVFTKPIIFVTLYY